MNRIDVISAMHVRYSQWYAMVGLGCYGKGSRGKR